MPVSALRGQGTSPLCTWHPTVVCSSTGWEPLEWPAHGGPGVELGELWAQSLGPGSAMGPTAPHPLPVPNLFLT